MKKNKCPECWGKGWIWRSCGSISMAISGRCPICGPAGGREAPCPRCGGKGEISAEAEAK